MNYRPRLPILVTVVFALAVFVWVSGIRQIIAQPVTPNSSDAAIQPVPEVESVYSDADHDGVVDSLDHCAQTPAMIIVDQNGCPDTSRILSTRIIPGLFPPGGTSLKYADPTQLDSVAAVMEHFRSVKVIIYGHTDDIGIDERNLRVSQERADAVQRYLIAKGIDENRVLSIGKGETEPIASNRKRAGRRLNRRIEIEFRQ